MTDILTPRQRFRCMSAIRAVGTAPERFLRRLLTGEGFRYRCNVDSLPGKPDFVFPARKKIIFMHGCFWHRHSCASGQSIPNTRRRFWSQKLEGNKNRDRRQISKLKRSGWRVLVVWQCQLKGAKVNRALARVLAFLDS
jgi:DNA mismatch endonuclease (patch repair protein)